MYKVSLANKTSFKCEEGETILAAAEKAGVKLPYSCKTGRCSSCRAEVVSGESFAKVDELGLNGEVGNAILTCVRTPLSDVQLNLEDFGDTEIPKAKLVPCRISSLERLAQDVIKVVLRTPPAQKIKYLAGQYVDIIGPAGIKRSYSIANAQTDEGLLELQIRAVLGGSLSQYWFEQAKVNDLLRLNGPLGTFFLRNMSDKNLVFLATGTGIAPVKAMLESLNGVDVSKLPASIQVFWGGRREEDLYWNPAEAYAGLPLEFVPVLSRADDSWKGQRGYVQNVLLQQRTGLTDVVVFACGSNEMIQDSRKQLVQRGLPSTNFYSDAFVCSSEN